MRVRFFAVPVHDSAEVQAELDRFLTSHRVIDLDRHLISDGMRSTWAICVTYVDTPAGTSSTKRSEAKPGKRDIDYRDVLSPEDFRVYASLRVLRKSIADKDGVPAYAVFTNEHLAAMVTGRVRSATELGKIPGVGPSRVEKHGAAFLAALREAAAAPPPTEVEHAS